MSPLLEQRPCIVGTESVQYRLTTRHKGGEEIVLNAITAMPVYEQQSFEELCLEDYMPGNRGKMDDKTVLKNIPASYKNWEGSNLTTFLEVDLGTEQLVLKRPTDGNMYTKQQCFHLIKTTTVKVSKDRRQLIRALT